MLGRDIGLDPLSGIYFLMCNLSFIHQRGNILPCDPHVPDVLSIKHISHLYSELVLGLVVLILHNYIDTRLPALYLLSLLVFIKRL